MWRELLVSVASGIIVALISAMFSRRSGGAAGQAGSEPAGKVIMGFLLGAAVVFVLLMFRHGRH